MLVGPGTYEENVSFEGKRIALLSSFGASSTTIHSVNQNEATVLFTSNEPKGAILKGFTISGGGRGGVYCKGSSPSVLNNIISGNRSTEINDGGGINLKNTSAALVKGNVIHDNHSASSGYGPAIHVGDDTTGSQSDTISFNVMYNNTGFWDVRVLGAVHDLQIHNNTIQVTTYGGIAGYYPEGGNADIRNNIVCNAPYYGITGYAGVVSYNCAFSNGTNFDGPLGIGNITLDAQLVNLTQRDFRLTRTSPCVDAGDPNPIYDDADGSRNDMGAIPYLRPPKTLRVPSQYAAIQMALDSSIDDDTVLISDGTYREHITLFAKKLIIKSAGGYQGCQVVSDTSRAISIFGPSTVTIEGLSITGRQTNTTSYQVYGGGIYAENSDLTIVDSWVRGCSVNAEYGQASGGGIYASNCSVSLIRSVIRGNFAGALGNATGGGIYCVGHLLIDLCIIDSNFSGYPGSLPSYHGGGSHSSGGIYSVGDSIEILRSTISFNSCGGSSLDKAEVGGILLAGNHATVEYDSILFNSSSGAAIDPTSEWGYSSWGGGLKATGDSSLISHNIIRGNSVSMGNHYRWPSTLRDLRGGGAFLSGAGNEFSYNIVSKNVVASTWDFPSYSSASVVSYGGGLYASGENRIFGNTFFGNVAGFQGLIWAGKVRLPVSTSELLKAYGGGSFIDGASMMAQNLFEANSTGGLCTGASDSLGCSTANLGAAVYAATSSTSCNTYFQNSGGDEWHGSASESDRNQNPLLCDTTIGDFRLKSSSPCLPANNSCGVQIGAFGVGCQNAAPVITSADATSINEDARLLYRATANDPDGPSLTFTFLNHPSWLTSDADSIYGTPHYPVHDTSFSVIASDGFLADAQVVNVTVHQLTPEVRVLRVDADTLNLHVTNFTPQFNWHYFDPTGSSPQTEFEVAVGIDTNWTYAEMWNPAPFISADSFVQYAGVPLLRGHTYYLRLRAYSGTHWSPWREGSFRQNSVPSIPVAKGPIDDQVVGCTPILWVNNATDAEGDPLSYDFDGYHDSACTSGPAISLTKVPGAADSTGGHIPAALSENCRYHWRSRSFDGYEYSDWSTYSTFVVDGTPEPPSAVTLISPPAPDGKPVLTMLPTLKWTPASDPDPYDTVKYRVELSLSSNFSLVFAKDSLLANSFKVLDSLQFGTHYWWRVSSRDKTSLVTMCQAPVDFWTWALGDVNSSHMTDLGDLSMIVSYLTGAGATISPKMVGDLNGDCKIDLADLSRLVNYLTGGSTRLVAGCQATGQRAGEIVDTTTRKLEPSADSGNMKVSEK